MTDDETIDPVTRRALLAALPLLALTDIASGQDATRVQPQSYRVAFENDAVRVLEYHSLPGLGVCGNGVHSHPAHLTVLLSSARVRVTPRGDKPQLLPEMPAGTVFWSEAETHETENVSGARIHSLLIEIKRKA